MVAFQLILHFNGHAFKFINWFSQKSTKVKLHLNAIFDFVSLYNQTNKLLLFHTRQQGGGEGLENILLNHGYFQVGILPCLQSGQIF